MSTWIMHWVNINPGLKIMFKAIQENDKELVNYYLKMGIDPNYQHPEFIARYVILKIPRNQPPQLLQRFPHRQLTHTTRSIRMPTSIKVFFC